MVVIGRQYYYFALYRAGVFFQVHRKKKKKFRVKANRIKIKKLKIKKSRATE
jgi:hypothetical protein